VDVYYYDDPVDEPVVKNKKPKAIFGAALLLFAGGLTLNTTLAANVSLNSGVNIQFGQGVQTTTACSGATILTVTPTSTFLNASGGGSFYFSSVSVANIPASCHGKDFTISAYNSSSSNPLPIFNTNATKAVVYNNAGTFQLGEGTTEGASITNPVSGKFTLTFTSPVALSTTVTRLTIQSSIHTQVASGYNVGDIGPGGGVIFYKDVAGFNCGPNYSATGSPTNGKCNYLEAAPSLWSGLEEEDQNEEMVPAKDSAFVFANVIQNLNEIVVAEEGPGGPGTLVPQVGRGYKNSLAIIAQGNNATTAAGAARAYRGGTKSDWYLPSLSEINLLCQWAKGVTGDATTACPSSGTPTRTGAGFEVLWDANPEASPQYSTSSEQFDVNQAVNWVWIINFSDANAEAIEKGQSARVRPIRAF
jgi:hypothetical protein